MAACAEVAFQDARQKHSGDNFRAQEELEADVRVAIRIAQTIQKLDLTKLESNLAPSTKEGDSSAK